MHVVAHTEHPEAREIVPSAHCVQRFRERMPIREPGRDVVDAALRETLERRRRQRLAAGLGGLRTAPPSCGR